MKLTKNSLDKKTKEDTEVEKQLREFLTSNEGCIPIEDAIKEAERKWPNKPATGKNLRNRENF